MILWMVLHKKTGIPNKTSLGVRAVFMTRKEARYYLKFFVTRDKEYHVVKVLANKWERPY